MSLSEVILGVGRPSVVRLDPRTPIQQTLESVAFSDQFSLIR
jgi:hypothetical protein